MIESGDDEIGKKKKKKTEERGVEGVMGRV